MTKNKITIVTPTYNRAHTLSRVYESLKKQTFKDFKWIIMDDGSTDNTKEIVLSFQLYVVKINETPLSKN